MNFLLYSAEIGPSGSWSFGEEISTQFKSDMRIRADDLGYHVPFLRRNQQVVVSSRW